VGAEAGVDDELLAVLWFGELEEEDARGEVVDVCETQRDELGRELVGDDLDVQRREALLHDHCSGKRLALELVG